MSDPNSLHPASRATEPAIAAFVEAARRTPALRAGPRGRLIFALDATMSRGPTWDLAQTLQGHMFDAVGGDGLEVQLVYFRGFHECRASRFVADGRGLKALMSGIEVRSGATQIGRVLAHAKSESTVKKVGVLVFIGDACEERVDELAQKAGELALAGVKVFMFQEGRDSAVAATFKDIARLTGGAYDAFDQGAAARLSALLRAAAVYAAGGRAALASAAKHEPAARFLLDQMR